MWIYFCEISLWLHHLSSGKLSKTKETKKIQIGTILIKKKWDLESQNINKQIECIFYFGAHLQDRQLSKRLSLMERARIKKWCKLGERNQRD